MQHVFQVDVVDVSIGCPKTLSWAWFPLTCRKEDISDLGQGIHQRSGTHTVDPEMGVNFQQHYGRGRHEERCWRVPRMGVTTVDGTGVIAPGRVR